MRPGVTVNLSVKKEHSMKTKIFVNLPVADLQKSMDFFAALGFTFNPQFTDANAACLVISDDIYSMLLVKDFFKTFIDKEVADAEKTTEVIVSLTVESRAAVDEMVEKALRAGAALTETRDHGWMYQRGFADLDGHLWEIFYMDMSAVPAIP